MIGIIVYISFEIRNNLARSLLIKVEVEVNGQETDTRGTGARRYTYENKTLVNAVPQNKLGELHEDPLPALRYDIGNRSPWLPA